MQLIQCGTVKAIRYNIDDPGFWSERIAKKMRKSAEICLRPLSLEEMKRPATPQKSGSSSSSSEMHRSRRR